MDTPQSSTRQISSLGKTIITLFLLAVFTAWIIGYFHTFGWLWALPLAFLTVWLNMLAHEMGHLIMGLLMQVKVRGIFLGCSPFTKPFGPRLQLNIGNIDLRIGITHQSATFPQLTDENEPTHYVQTMLILAAGPAMSILLFAACIYSMSLPGTLIATVAAFYIVESLAPWGTTDMTSILELWHEWQAERRLNNA